MLKSHYEVPPEAFYFICCDLTGMDLGTINPKVYTYLKKKKQGKKKLRGSAEAAFKNYSPQVCRKLLHL